MSENEFEDGQEPIVGDAPPQAKTLLSNKAYDRTKFFALIVLPALAVFYGSFGATWGLAYTEQVVTTMVALDLFLGAVLQVSTKQYKSSDARYDGTMYIRKDENVLGETVLKAGYAIDTPAEVVERKDEVVFKVEEAGDEVM